jgi:hypothetical protein
VKKDSLALRMLMMAAMYSAFENPSTPFDEPRPIRKPHAWDKIQLSKAERKGKTADEMQSLRKIKYEGMIVV